MKREPLILVAILSLLPNVSIAWESRPTQIPQGYEVSGVYQIDHYKVELRLEPTKPTVRQAVAANFNVWDLSQDPPAPVVGAKLSCVIRMPGMPGHDHKGHVHEQRHPQDQAGGYSMLPISLAMAGSWELVLRVQIPDGQDFSATFPFAVEDSQSPDNPNADNVGPRTSPAAGAYYKGH